MAEDIEVIKTRALERIAKKLYEIERTIALGRPAVDFTTSAVVTNRYHTYEQLNEREKDRLKQLAEIGLSVLLLPLKNKKELYSKLESSLRFHFGNNKPRSPLANHLVLAMKKASLKEYFDALKQSKKEEGTSPSNPSTDWSDVPVTSFEEKPGDVFRVQAKLDRSS